MIENIKTTGFEQQPCNEWEDRVLHNWNLIFFIMGVHRPNPREHARWDCPPENWFKINFDGASKGNLGKEGCGVVIRNSNGDYVGGMAIPIGDQTNHVAEAYATLHGLLYAKSMNLRKIWVEGDSLNIINCLNKITKPLWTISNIIFKASQIINSFQTGIIIHNFREANHTIDWATNVACFSDHKIIWDFYESLPLDGRQLIEYDKWRSKQKYFNHDGVSDLQL